jgi:hypothetical protein
MTERCSRQSALNVCGKHRNVRERWIHHAHSSWGFVGAAPADDGTLKSLPVPVSRQSVERVAAYK